jgi:hypothetical protein
MILRPEGEDRLGDARDQGDDPGLLDLAEGVLGTVKTHEDERESPTAID